MNIDQYLQKYHTKETAKSYLYQINHFLKVNSKANMYSYQDILSYINTIEVPTKRKNHLAAIKKYYEFLEYTDKRNDHPCKGLTIKLKRSRAIQIQELFTAEELQKLLTRENRYKDLELRNKAIISLLIYQGLQSSELCKLRIQDIDLDKGTVYIMASKRATRRTLELHRTQLLVFDKYIYQYRNKLSASKSSKMFFSIRGLEFNADTLNSIVDPLKMLFLDRNLNPKTIRQSVISNWLNERKISLSEVQLMAGHRYPSSTEKYRRKDIDNQRKLINKYHPLK